MQMHNLTVLTTVFYIFYSQKHVHKGIQMSGESTCFPDLVHVKLRNFMMYMFSLHGDEKMFISIPPVLVWQYTISQVGVFIPGKYGQV